MGEPQDPSQQPADTQQPADPAEEQQTSGEVTAEDTSTDQPPSSPGVIFHGKTT